jgi:hypothetical protein
MPKTKLVGSVEVDSGTIIISDPAYVMTKKRYDDLFDNLVVHKEVDVPQSFLDEEKGLTREGWGRFYGQFDPQTVGKGYVVSRTQVGDGSFPVYAEYSGEGELLSLTIRFDGEDDEAEEDWLLAGSQEKLGDDDGS